MIIDRRDALAGMVAMFGASLFAPIARAAAAQMTPISDGPPSTPVFTAQQRALMTALSERVMPTTDTPGAITAGVPAFIEKLLADWAAPGDRKPIVAGLDAIETRSQADYKVAADKATPAQQDALLTLAMEDKIPGGKDFFEKFRQLVITGYFTSEVGITQEREYLPVPGRYDGAYPYSKVNKVFSS
ncbi:gluconate 2-dehydrogenase subunit 3 family protein [Sphingomonas sp. 7/4-4]|nr:gluconate 2-dehydrogenase subunit 3 family protein [Sphingomonas sp. 7/4-4]WBY08777.1 gluconate 2-dehydrogenase subunit 3 family protein [Sphingomonas sp. 7/4-4]